MEKPKEKFIQSLINIVNLFEKKTGAEIVMIKFNRASYMSSGQANLHSAISSIDLTMRRE